MPDIAVLGIDVDSRSVNPASVALDKLTAAAAKTGRAINVKKGQAISQGQNVGAVGATGWATGPHLHFEFRVNGTHQDPLMIARQSESIPVSASAKPLFDKAVGSVRVQLAAASLVTQASAD